MSAYEKTPDWKSPRKVEQEITDYKRKRFEEYMQRVDQEKITRGLAIAAFREEIEGIAVIESVYIEETPTLPFEVQSE